MAVINALMQEMPELSGKRQELDTLSNSLVGQLEEVAVAKLVKGVIKIMGYHCSGCDAPGCGGIGWVPPSEVFK